MPKQHNKSMSHKKSSNKGRPPSSKGPSVTALNYKGSLVANDVKDGQPIAVNIVSYSSMGTTSVANVATFNTVFSSTVVTGASDFTDWSSLYQEFRVLGIEASFFPADQNALTPYVATNVQSPFFILPYHGEASAIISTNNAVQHAPYSVHCLNQPQKAVVRMSEADEAQWFSTSSATVPVMGFKTWFTGNTAGATDVYYFGTMIFRGLVQFRGRVVSTTQLVKQPVSVSLPAAKEQKDEKTKEEFVFVPKTGYKK